MGSYKRDGTRGKYSRDGCHYIRDGAEIILVIHGFDQFRRSISDSKRVDESSPIAARMIAKKIWPEKMAVAVGLHVNSVWGYIRNPRTLLESKTSLGRMALGLSVNTEDLVEEILAYENKKDKKQPLPRHQNGQ